VCTDERVGVMTKGLVGWKVSWFSSLPQITFPQWIGGTRYAFVNAFGGAISILDTSNGNITNVVSGLTKYGWHVSGFLIDTPTMTLFVLESRSTGPYTFQSIFSTYSLSSFSGVLKSNVTLPESPLSSNLGLSSMLSLNGSVLLSFCFVQNSTGCPNNCQFFKPVGYTCTLDITKPSMPKLIAKTPEALSTAVRSTDGLWYAQGGLNSNTGFVSRDEKQLKHIVC
jgi:hypothetical protein